MEYDAILSEAGGENQDFYVSRLLADVYEDSGDGAIRRHFTSIGLLHKLRETRAYVGFSRWLPDDGKTLEARKDFIKLGKTISWLPALVVKGEGVFFEFNEKRLNDWAAQKEMKSRVNKFIENYNIERTKRGKEQSNNISRICFDSHICSFGYKSV